MYEINKFPEEYLRQFKREIAECIVTRNTDVGGFYWEHAHARSLNIPHARNNEKIIDVAYGRQIAWSVKSRTFEECVNDQCFEYHLFRNDLNRSRGSPANCFEDAARVGGKLIANANKIIEEIVEKYHEARTLLIIRRVNLRDVRLWEHPISLLPYDGWEWRWKNKGNLHGRRGDERLRFQLNGSQFHYAPPVPREALTTIRLSARLQPASQPQILALARYDDSMGTVESEHSPASYRIERHELGTIDFN